MGDSFAVDPRKLEWSRKLCALLLNDGTNVLRWFLKENLPRNKEEKSDLNAVSVTCQYFLNAALDLPYGSEQQSNIKHCAVRRSRVNRTSAAETEDLGSIPDRLKPKTIKIGIRIFPA